MNISVEGKIERKGFGTGTWAIISDNGQSYEIYQGAPNALLKSGQKVKVTGKVRNDIMTMAMIGPVLEVQTFEVLD
ncbi:MAG: hypothetical protein N3E45_09870 [Oscillatoriaceae bacterium SKW80]|nr:hypothetical protein [Oscillatoriaceae bacterium SKYG93]MCX8121122.1 hypothetical protein [Oscillatoriaceae bacterium SKW80]MDW8453548.1 hypothetical protein [Oscillatoriaceae cyanobacterium SKYGB_i_bin93]HIK26899.1 hypothetical protein [Oscillatoriaceae cyanobacterium M7585_C2015_266]